MQRGAADRDAADVDGLELGDRRQRAGAADADEDVLDGGGFFLGRELPGDGPARRPRDRAEPAALVLAVDLHHAAVDLVRQLVPFREHALVLVAHRVERLAQLVLRVRPQAVLAQFRELFPVAGERRRLAHLVEIDAQRPLRGDARIELPQRAGRAVARIDERRLAGFLALLVHADEIALVDEDLAAHFEQPGRLAFELQRYHFYST